MPHRRYPADNFLGGADIQLRPLAPQRKLLGMLKQRLHAAADRRRGGVVAGGGGDNEIAGLVEHVHWLAIHLGVGEHGRQIVPGVLLAVFDDLAEIGTEIVQHIQSRGLAVGALQ